MPEFKLLNTIILILSSLNLIKTANINVNHNGKRVGIKISFMHLSDLCMKDLKKTAFLFLFERIGNLGENLGSRPQGKKRPAIDHHSWEAAESPSVGSWQSEEILPNSRSRAGTVSKYTFESHEEGPEAVSL